MVMNIQLEEIGIKHPKALTSDDRTAYISSNRTAYISSNELKEFSSNGDEKISTIPKVRKPYTITKQRERWTEEQHNKFLEALQLYGRAWRRIEEHVGTKTAVQIRSHAQKFFSKVTRESTTSDTSETIKAFEIPPPRPKRKPSHPCPRKVGNSPIFKQFTPLLSEQGEESPASTSPAVESDDPASSCFQSCKDVYHSSTVKSASGSSRQSPVSTVLQGSSPGLFANAGHKHTESHHLPCGKVASQEASSAEAVATIRLFGKTLPLVDRLKPLPSPSGGSSLVQNAEPPCAIEADPQHVTGMTIGHEPSTLTMQGCNYVSLSPNSDRNLWNSYAGRIPLPPCSFDPSGDNSTSTSTTTSHLQRPFFWRTLPSRTTDPRNTSPVSCPASNGIDALSNHDTQRQCSRIGSTITCHNGVTITNRDPDVVDSEEAGDLDENEQPPCSRLKLTDTSAFRSWKQGLNEPRTRLPRKICRAVSGSSVDATENLEGPTIRLCK